MRRGQKDSDPVWIPMTRKTRRQMRLLLTSLIHIAKEKSTDGTDDDTVTLKDLEAA